MEKRSMLAGGLAALLLGGSVVFGTGAWSQITDEARQKASAALPEGEGKAFVTDNCLKCHDLTPIASNGFSEQGWVDTIHRFIGQSRPEAEVRVAAAYLAKNFPPRAASPAASAAPQPVSGAVAKLTPVTDEMLRNPDQGDWLHPGRTYDAQRYSPLKQITKTNVTDLRLAWALGLGAKGFNTSTPLVHDGIIYIDAPASRVLAVDGKTGQVIWEYTQDVGETAATSRSKNIALYQDVVVYAAVDGHMTGLDARTGKVRWQTKVGSSAASGGLLVVKGKVISGRSCWAGNADCFIAAHDALTGKEVWRFYTMPRPGQPGSETWGKADISKFIVSTWGTAGSYDSVRDVIYWGVANPSPYTRLERYGSHDAVPTKAPSELYSNSTVALDPETGKLKWYYQHLPGDDWDQDYSQERVLARTRFNPDPKSVKWINPDVKRGEARDVVVNVGEGGGLFVLDRGNGQFLWAMPFPYDAPNFLISDIDGKTGRVQLNEDLIAKKPGDRNVLCAYNTDSYWMDAYNPQTNSLYAPFADSCLDMTAAGPAGPQKRFGVLREGGDPEKFSGIAKVNLETGEVLRFGEGRAPTNGSVLATASNLIFHGTLDRKFRAYDAENGKVLWEATLGGPVQTSTITYAIDGKQYLLVMTGESSLSPNLARQAGIPFVKDHHAFYVFALPD